MSSIYGKTIKKVHGPYNRYDGRKHVVIVFEDLSKRTVSYPKYLMEQHLGRILDPDLETIDHIDRDYTNDNLDNLRIVERSKHCKEDAVHVELVEFTCALCGCIGRQAGRNLKHNKKLGKAGPFCGKSCAGKYGAYVQNGYLEKFGNTYEDVRKYYYLIK